MNIRSATLEDAPAIAEILFSLEEIPNYRSYGLDGLETRVRAGLTGSGNRSVLVAEFDDIVLGYAAVHWFTPVMTASEGHIGDLFVHADSSNQGLGSALLEEVVREAKSRGCRRLTLINWRYQIAYQREFYAKRGWTEQPETVRFVLNLEGDL
jgi:GNAT superfamily N-acetyltransferase